jgi:hypothetical protein
MIRFIVATFILSFGLALNAQERYVRPADEAAHDASFFAFRSKLIAAAERRDARFIYSILDPQITHSFGSHAGVGAFKRYWKIESPRSRFWEEFLTVIRNGGHWAKLGEGPPVFAAPYTFNGFPDDLDLYEHAAVFGTSVALRKSPTPAAPLVARLSYNIVRLETENLPRTGRSRYAGWWRVRTLGGLEGYIRKEFVRSPIDLRAGFEKKRGQWKMVFFIAGD